MADQLPEKVSDRRKSPGQDIVRVDGWDSLAEILRGGLEGESSFHGSFESLEEVKVFVAGSRDYRDRNSYFLDSKDFIEQKEEGFFREAYCPSCLVDEVVEADELEDSGLQEARMDFFYDRSRVKSFRPGFEKYVEWKSLNCLEHPEHGIVMRRKEYVER